MIELSPEYLLKIFEKLPRRPVSLAEVMTLAGAPTSHRALIHHMMNAMAREGQLVRLRNKYFMLPEAKKLVSGAIQVSLRGTGFLLGGDDEGADLYIHRTNLNTAIDGDTVEAEIFMGPKGRNEGRVIQVLNRAHETLVGEFTRRSKTRGTVVPRNIKLGRWVELPDAPPANKLADGAWVLVRVTKWSADPETPLIGNVEEILGNAGDRGLPVLVLIRDMGIEPDFPGEVLRQVAHIKPEAHMKDLSHRLDLRSETIFTIDPKTAKDHDDAVSVKKLDNGNWELGVHIADVSEFVKPDTPLDQEALRRATSIYPVDRVVPMLPERLSADICSLREKEDRLTLSAIMEITPEGNVAKFRMAESIINSRHKLSYDEVQEFYDHPKKAGSFEFIDIGEDLLAARELARIITAKRMERGALDLDLPEMVVDCNPEGDTIGLQRRERFESHRLIEEFMILANEVVADHLRKMQMPMIYRIHDIPNPTALEKLGPALGLFGVKVPRKVVPTPAFYQPMVERMHRVDGGHIGQRLLLRTLMRAEYSPTNKGHFGLASKCYCHFTSPIRRYPDLVVHRSLKSWLRGVTPDSEWAETLTNSLASISNQSNLMADKAVGIELQAGQIKAMEFMKDHEGAIFEGWISGIIGRGFFVEFVDLPVEGFVPADTMRDDTYTADEYGIKLVGRNNRRTYPLGRRVQVRIIRVSEMEGEMDLELVENSPSGKKGKRKGRKHQ